MQSRSAPFGRAQVSADGGVVDVEVVGDFGEGLAERPFQLDLVPLWHEIVDAKRKAYPDDLLPTPREELDAVR